MILQIVPSWAQHAHHRQCYASIDVVAAAPLEQESGASLDSLPGQTVVLAAPATADALEAVAPVPAAVLLGLVVQPMLVAPG